jgi:hypothetical protein
MWNVILYSIEDPYDKYVAGYGDTKEKAEALLKEFLEMAVEAGFETSGYIEEENDV